MPDMEKQLSDALASLEETPGQSRSRPYSGQQHTDAGARGEQLVHGLTMRDVRDCFIRAFIMSHDYDIEDNKPYIREAKKGVKGCLAADDVFNMKGDIDPMAVGQNLTCEIERVMGIFPNIDTQKCRSDTMKMLGITPSDDAE